VVGCQPGIGSLEAAAGADSLAHDFLKGPTRGRGGDVSERLHVSIEVSDDQLERLARRAAEIVLAARQPPERSTTYLSVGEAAEVLRCRPQRVHDLLSQGRLTRVKDGRRTLVLRVELEAYLRGEPTGAWTTPPRRRQAA
jgi:excisionase family DNA binding protein